MPSTDSFQRFHFEHLGIRGEIVRLEDAWLATQGASHYPCRVAAPLGEAMVAVLLLSGTIKFEGSLILQVQGSGPIKTLVAQATHQRTIRGLAHFESEPSGASLDELFGEGRMVITIQNRDMEPYQGIVALEGASLAEAIEGYFERSEQLPTRLWLTANEHRAGGLFLQALPGHERDEDDWNRIHHLAATVTHEELLELPPEALLFRLFHEETVRLQEPEIVRFRCGCSRSRIESVLMALGPKEVQSLSERDEVISVHCEFCNREYVFDRVDTTGLFLASGGLSPNTTRQ